MPGSSSGSNSDSSTGYLAAAAVVAVVASFDSAAGQLNLVVVAVVLFADSLEAASLSTSAFAFAATVAADAGYSLRRKFGSWFSSDSAVAAAAASAGPTFDWPARANWCYLAPKCPPEFRGRPSPLSPSQTESSIAPPPSGGSYPAAAVPR